jgi:hypothetical protein
MVKVKFTFEQAMKAIKALDGGEWLTSRPGPLSSGKENRYSL